MRNRSFKFFIIAFMLILSACADKKGPVLEGTRVSILKHDANSIADLQTRFYPIVVPDEFTNLNWPQTAGYPNHVMENLSLNAPEALKKSWSKSIGSGNSSYKRILGQPIVVEDIIYTIDSQSNVMAHDFSNGKKIWHEKLKPAYENSYSMGGGVAFAEDFLIATTGYGEVVAMDPANGEVKWRKRVNAPIRVAPVIVSGRVFVMTATNKTYALTLFDGNELWTHTGLSENSEILGGAVPAATNDAIIVTYSSGEVFALRQVNGIPLWEENLSGLRYTDMSSALADILANPVVIHNTVLVSSHNGKFVAIDVRLGKQIWSLPVALNEMPWVSGDVAYVLTSKNDLLAMTIDKGEIIWVTSLPIYTNEEKHTGDVIWYGPIMGQNLIWVAGTNKALVAYSAQTGIEVARYKLGGVPAQAPIIVDNKLVVLTTSGQLEVYASSLN